jgi:penicillin-binding protein 1A
MMNTMLQETLLTGTARKAELPGWQAAGKTGTSQDYRDAWFVGYTSQLVAGVWLGNDDGSPTRRTSGANLPVDIWSRFMREALRGMPPSPLPSGVWRDPTQPTAPPSLPPSQPEETPTVGAAPVQLPVSRTAAPPTPQPVAQNVSQVAAPTTRTPRRDPIADLLPPASIPQSGGVAQRAPPVRQRGFFDTLFGE